MKQEKVMVVKVVSSVDPCTGEIFEPKGTFYQASTVEAGYAFVQSMKEDRYTISVKYRFVPKCMVELEPEDVNFDEYTWHYWTDEQHKAVWELGSLKAKIKRLSLIKKLQHSYRRFCCRYFDALPF
jgi:hypothetical protein